jgi:hypothetical protein
MLLIVKSISLGITTLKVTEVVLHVGFLHFPSQLFSLSDDLSLLQQDFVEVSDWQHDLTAFVSQA